MIRVEDRGLVYYQFARLRAEYGVRHACFTRLGGVSSGPYASLNVGGSVGDDPQSVAENRRRCLAALGLGETQAVSPYQVHSTAIARVGAGDAGRIIEATDGLLTDDRGLALLLRFADCVPIMLYDPGRPALGLVHAGWRGTLEGIAGQAVLAMQDHFGSDPRRLWVGIGPAIGRCCYEVGRDLGRSFAERFGQRVLDGARQGRPRLDLPAANALALREAGVRRIEQAHLCTACHTGEFFSHRSEGGCTGRLAVVMALPPVPSPRA
jgi:YfiH family protein